ncbi:MFS transporter [Alicyclobacillus sp. SO9]|uniref:MFS transporter n=1 Tax=Alicyclobacillus sp. SO9 TaxID=2665646 RepID=UPI0018E8112F|nr:MFS transporter [Alicyclobacillus sp. SO9]QQE80991.1 MFS transporter [Alicyclobacillus sp. SO9]
MRQNSFFVLSVLLLAAVVSMLPNAVLFPAAHDIAVHLHVPVSFVGLMVTSYSIAYVAATPVFGILSDYAGRKSVLLVGLVLFGLGGIVPLVVQQGVMILAGRVVMGIGSAGVLPMVDSTIGDMYEAGANRRKALAAFGGAIAVAEAVLPFLSGLCDSISWRGVFMLYTSAFVSALLVTWIVWPKKLDEPDSYSPHGYLRALKLTSTMPALFGALLCTVLFGVVYFGVSSLLPLSVDNGNNGLLNGFLFLPLGISWVASSAWFVKRPHIVKVHRAILLGSLILAVGTILLGLTHKVLFLLAISLVWGLGSGILTTLYSWVVGDETPARVRGAVNALYNAAYVLGFAIGAPLFLYLKEVWSYQWSATTAGGVMIVSGVLGYILIRIGQHASPAL